MVQRVTLRTRSSYSTKSNGKRIVKTPGTSRPPSFSWASYGGRHQRAGVSLPTGGLGSWNVDERSRTSVTRRIRLAGLRIRALRQQGQEIARRLKEVEIHSPCSGRER